MARPFRAAEFFAGIGLVRQAIESVGGGVVFANDIEPAKQALYERNFPSKDFRLGDVRQVKADEIPDVELATASFPCTDLSLAGNRAGLGGKQSGMFWQFARIVREMGTRAPRGILLENVPSFATSNEGADLEAAIRELNDLGYLCDAIVVNASAFVPQSRPRLFVLGIQSDEPKVYTPKPSALRPRWLCRFLEARPELGLRLREHEPPEQAPTTLRSVVERLASDDDRWWDGTRLRRFKREMSQIQRNRLSDLMRQDRISWRTAYRRTRAGEAVWEIRRDEISGCLRTARGGSSKQALVEAGRGKLRVRWMIPREYARLQGVEDSYQLSGVSPNQALFGFGDAVCVPVVAWVLRQVVLPELHESPAPRSLSLAGV